VKKDGRQVRALTLKDGKKFWLAGVGILLTMLLLSYISSSLAHKG